MTLPPQPVLEIEFSSQSHWRIDELCALCAVDALQIQALVDEGLLQAEATSAEWALPASELSKLRTALRLIRDLQINPPGAALAVQLLDEIAQLRAELAVYQARPGHSSR